MTKSILFFILFIFFTGYLRSQTNTLSFAFEDHTLPTNLTARIENDLMNILVVIQDNPPFLVPYVSTNAPAHTVARIDDYSSSAFPRSIISRVEYITRDSAGKESIWISKEVSDIYTNRFAEITAEPIPFAELTALADRLQRVGSEPLSEEEFERHVIVPKSIMPVNPSGASFSAMSSNRTFYPPSILSIRKIQGEELEELRQMFRDEDLPELTPDSLPVYEAFIVVESRRTIRIAAPQACFFFNGCWHVVP